MSYNWGTRTAANLATCHLDLITGRNFVLAMKIVDLAILWGFRDKAQQNGMFNAVPPASGVEWPDSYHNALDDQGVPLSDALDFAPWVLLPNGKMGVPWMDTHAFAMVGGLFLAAGSQLDIGITWGGDFDRDGLTIDHRLGDYGHIQRIRT